MGQQFSDWLRCPACEDGGTDISVVAYNADVVLECYTCGARDEFTIGEDVPVNSLDADAIAGDADTVND